MIASEPLTVPLTARFKQINAPVLGKWVCR